MTRLEVRLGDCVEVMRALEPESVGAVVCDPPYDLVGASRNGSPQPGDMSTPYGRSGPSKARGFMNAEWDGTGVAFRPETWVSVCRVLIPGGVVKAFSGTRTYHKMARAMEEAGFLGVHLEAWCYSSGFPKSLSVGKSLDRQWGRLTDGSEGAVTTLKKELRKLYDESGKSRKQVDTECGFRACNYLSYPEPGKRHDPWFNVLPSTEKWAVIKQVLGVEESGVSARLDDFFREAVREVIGYRKCVPIGYRKCVPGLAFSSEGPSELPVTLPATVEAVLWEDWGTALKPAWEPVLVGRKLG